jgi:hypothetical protein
VARNFLRASIMANAPDEPDVNEAAGGYFVSPIVRSQAELSDFRSALRLNSLVEVCDED